MSELREQECPICHNLTHEDVTELEQVRAERNEVKSKALGYLFDLAKTEAERSRYKDALEEIANLINTLSNRQLLSEGRLARGIARTALEDK